MTPDELKRLRELAAIHTSRFPIFQLLDEIELANRKLEKAKAALEKLSKQQTPEEYEDEFNEIPSDELLAEGYEYTVLAARAALAEIENQEGESK